MSSVKKKISGVFSEIFRFIDDLLSFNVEMSKFSMYPKFLRLENKIKTNSESEVNSLTSNLKSSLVKCFTENLIKLEISTWISKNTQTTVHVFSLMYLQALFIQLALENLKSIGIPMIAITI